MPDSTKVTTTVVNGRICFLVDTPAFPKGFMLHRSSSSPCGCGRGLLDNADYDGAAVASAATAAAADERRTEFSGTLATVNNLPGSFRKQCHFVVHTIDTPAVERDDNYDDDDEMPALQEME